LTRRALAAFLFAACILARAAAEPDHVHIAIAVLDAQGRAVGGLSVRDFEVREDGIPQTISAVEPRHAAPRRIAILLDEFHVDAAHTTDVRSAASRFVATGLRPDDSVVVLKPLDPLTRIALSADRDEAQHAIATFDGREGNYEPRSTLEAETMGRAPALVEAGRSQVVLSALRALASQLGSVPGRSAILLVSEGFMPTKPTATRGLPDVSIVERFANRYDVPVFAIDPAGPAPDGPDETPPELLLDSLARATGGTIARGDDMLGELTRAAANIDGGYTISFDSTHGEDGKYHTIEVSMARRTPARPERTVLQVHARAGYISPPSAEMRRAARAALNTPMLSLRPLHRSPWIDVWTGITGVDDGRARVAVTWAPQPRVAVNGTMTKSTAARVMLQAKAHDGTVLFDGTLSPVRAGEIQDASAADRAEFVAPSGTIELNMTIFGVRGEKLDVDMRDVDIPALGSVAPVLMPAIVVGTWSAKEFNAVSSDPDVPPDPSREFSRMQRLVIRVPAYAGGRPIPVSGHLLNRTGQSMRAIDAMPPMPTGITQFDLPLASLSPGDYYLLFSATHEGKTVEQRVEFRLTG
jgi:VWFA-related protein